MSWIGGCFQASSDSPTPIDRFVIKMNRAAADRRLPSPPPAQLQRQPSVTLCVVDSKYEVIKEAGRCVNLYVWPDFWGFGDVNTRSIDPSSTGPWACGWWRRTTTAATSTGQSIANLAYRDIISIHQSPTLQPQNNIRSGWTPRSSASGSRGWRPGSGSTTSPGWPTSRARTASRRISPPCGAASRYAC